MDSNQDTNSDMHPDTNPDSKVDKKGKPVKELTLHTRVDWNNLENMIAILHSDQDLIDLWNLQCFSKWIDVQTTKTDTPLMHAFFKLESRMSYDIEFDGLYYDVGGPCPLRFGPREFSCITGLTFGDNCDITDDGAGDRFSKRIKFNGTMTREKLKRFLDVNYHKLKKEDVVRLCNLLVLYSVFLGCESTKVVEPVHLNLVENLEMWNAYHWGVPIWDRLSKSIHMCYFRRDKDKLKKPSTSYSTTGFVWAFKIWIFESLPYLLSRRHCQYSNTIPRCFGWTQTSGLQWGTVAAVMEESSQPPFLPRLMSFTEEEKNTPWFRDTLKYLDEKWSERKFLLLKMKREQTLTVPNTQSTYEHIQTQSVIQVNPFDLPSNLVNQTCFEGNQSTFQMNQINQTGRHDNQSTFLQNQGRCELNNPALQGNQLDTSQRKQDSVNSLFQNPTLKDVSEQLARIIKNQEDHKRETEQYHKEYAANQLYVIKLNQAFIKTSQKHQVDIITSLMKLSSNLANDISCVREKKTGSMENVEGDIHMDDLAFCSPLVGSVTEVSPNANPKSKREKRV
ncbi:uncharacterized protein LOC143578738 [Bidens hawaiensis]|uniref:uncharacterized protein LOC143578738 n=1 Tax=Bidens hawaiensis TaxID=980011 RepID=UPI004049AF6B